MFFCTGMAWAQSNRKGTVSGNDDKLPVIGASVTIKGTGIGTITDINGAFSINASAEDVLVITYIGYQVSEVTVGDKIIIPVLLIKASTTLNEVVVTGYTSQRKKDITGSIAVVNIASLKSVPSGSTESLLQGQASGVSVVNSGNPGGGSQINIRGISTLGNSSPLVLIDGVPGNLRDLNVNDIESMQVLKDAGSASIYGVRGSNGVVIVTTKKGKKGKTTITYDGYYGTQMPLANGFKLAGTQTYMDALFQMQKNSGIDNPTHPQFGTGTFTIPDYILPAGAKEGAPNTDPSTYNINTNQITRANKEGTDWYHEIFKQAPIQSHNVTAAGGSEKSNFLFSLNYFDQQGTLINTYLKRYSVRANSDFKIGHVRIGENLFTFFKDNPIISNQNEGNAIAYAFREPPIIPVYDIMGNFAGTKAPGLGNSQNGVGNQIRSRDNQGYNWQTNGNVFAEVDFAKNFTARSSIGGNIENYYSYFFSPTLYENAEGNTSPNSFTEISGFRYNRTWTNTLNYSRRLKNHDIKVLLGTENIKNYGRGQFGTRGNYTLSTDPNYVNLNTGSPSTATNGVQQLFSNTLNSYFARIDYSFKDRYLLSGTIRRDGSSFFAPDQRWGTFPSVTAGWRISQENFMKGISWLNDLKFRGGYGVLGSLSGVSNQPNNAFSLFAASPSNSYYDIRGTGNSTILGTYKSQLGNLGTTWESDAIANLGFDATLFNNKLELSFEVYKKTITGLLFRQSILATGGGAAAPFVNGGNIENKGIDFSATYHGTVRDDLKFDAGINLSTYSNKVASLPNGLRYQDYNSAGSTRLGSFVRLQPGRSVGEFFGYQVERLFRDAADVTASPTQASAAPGRFKYKDVNNDGKISEDDRTFFGNPNPKFTGGFNLNVSYKNFDMNAFLYGSYGNKVLNLVRYWTNFPQVFGGNVSADIISNSWSPTNQNARIPILETSANFSNTGVFNSFYMEDGSYLRLKSLTLGYTLPGAKLTKYGISKIRIYVLATNLFTLTKYTGLDPELQNSNLNDNTSFGIDFGNYPANQKNYNIGLNVTF